MWNFVRSAQLFSQPKEYLPLIKSRVASPHKMSLNNLQFMWGETETQIKALVPDTAVSNKLSQVEPNGQN